MITDMLIWSMGCVSCNMNREMQEYHTTQPKCLQLFNLDKRERGRDSLPHRHFPGGRHRAQRGPPGHARHIHTGSKDFLELLRLV